MNILIVGKNSYIGQGVGDWIHRNAPQARVDYISVRDDGWKQMDLSGFDTVIFTAALVHRPDVTDWAQYEAVNISLPFQFARYAKAQGVKQFLFMSTVSVYQAQRTLPKATVITADTPLSPASLYGKSKLLAEQQLQTLAEESFQVSIIRATYVYGKGCRGRHIAVQRQLARRLPLLPKAFPDVPMGMVYIDNLAQLCWLIANSGQSGIYHAQDKAPCSTWQILKIMAPGKKSVPCQWFFRLLAGLSPVKRLFGGAVYQEALARCSLGDYQRISMADGIRRSIQ